MRRPAPTFALPLLFAALCTGCGPLVAGAVLATSKGGGGGGGGAPSTTGSSPSAPTTFSITLDVQTGPAAGGTRVTATITTPGRALTSAPSVQVGGARASGVTLLGPTSFSFDTPPSPDGNRSGAQPVKVSTGGASATSSFRYVAAPPTVAGASPAVLDVDGGEAVTVTGTGFVAGTTVLVGGAPATGVVVTGATQLTCVTPAGAPGPADLVVVHPDAGAATLVGGVRFVAHLRIASAPAQVLVGQPFSITVEAVSGAGALVPSFTSSASVAVLSGPGGAALTGTLSRAASGGVVTFAGLALDTAGSYTLSLTSADATATTHDVEALTPRLAFLVEPATGAPGAPIEPAVVVALVDGAGAVAAIDAPITLDLDQGPAGATLSGARTVTATAGVARFFDLSLDLAGDGFTLQATSPGLTPVTTAPFSVADVRVTALSAPATAAVREAVTVAWTVAPASATTSLDGVDVTGVASVTTAPFPGPRGGVDPRRALRLSATSPAGVGERVEVAAAARAGGAGSEGARGVAVASDGALLVVGAHEAGATFGAGEADETTLGAGGCYVARYAPDATLLWVRAATTPAGAVAAGVVALSDGGCVVVGSFDGPLVLGAGEANETTLVSAGGRDVFVARFGADGALAWARRAGGVNGDEALGVARAIDGAVVVVGYHGGATFGAGEPTETTLASAGDVDAFVARFDDDGALRWAKSAGGAVDDMAAAVAVTAADEMIVTGYFKDVATFAPGEPDAVTLSAPGTSHRLFVARYAGAGVLVHVAGADGGASRGRGVVALSDGGCVVAGDLHGTVALSPGRADATTVSGAQDALLVRYDVDGRVQWARTAGGSAIDAFYGVTTEDGDGVLVGGRFGGPAVLGQGELHEARVTAVGHVLAAYRPDGSLAWARAHATTNPGGPSVSALEGGGAVLVGAFGGALTTAPGPGAATLTASGVTDAFVTVLSPVNYRVVHVRPVGLAWVRYGTPGAGVPDAAAAGDESIAADIFQTSSFVLGPGEPDERTFTLGPGQTDDTFLLGFTPAGAVTWSLTAEPGGIGRLTPLPDRAFLLNVTASRGLVLDPGAPDEIVVPSGTDRQLIARLAADGRAEWVKGWTSSRHSPEMLDLVACMDGTAWAVGAFTNVVGFGPAGSSTDFTAQGAADLFVVRFGRSGDLALVRTAGGPAAFVDARKAIALPDGGLLVVGTHTDSITFGAGEANQTTLTAAGQLDGFIARYAVGGELLWARAVTGPGIQSVTGACLGLDDDLFVVGYGELGAVLGPGAPNETTLPAQHAFVARYLLDGSLSRVHDMAPLGALPSRVTTSGVHLDVAGRRLVVVLSPAGRVVLGRGEPREIVVSGSDHRVLATYLLDGTLESVRRVVGRAFLRGDGKTPRGDLLIMGDLFEPGTFDVGQPGATAVPHPAVNPFDMAPFLARFHPSSPGPLATLPAAPANLAAAPGDAQVTLTWDHVPNATGYVLYVGTSPGVTPATGTPIPAVEPPFVHTGLTNGTTYHYVITATNVAGESAASAEASAAPIETPPAPTGVVASRGFQQVTVSWDPAPRAASYTLYWRTSSGVTPANGAAIPNVTSPFVHAGLTNGQPYFYVVTATNAGGESPASAEVQATPTDPPPAPTGLAAAPGFQQVTLSWSAAPDASSYTAYWGTSPGVTPATGTAIPNVTSPFVHGGLTNGSTYHYVVTATNPGGEGAASAPASATPLDPPAAPSGLAATAGNATVTLTWSPVGGAVDHVVYWSTTPGVTPATGTAIPGITATSFAHAGRTNGTAYHYVVVARNAGGESAPSSEVSATPALPAPAGVRALAGAGEVRVEWTSVPNATRYVVAFDTSPGVTTATGTRLTTTDPWLDHTGLTNGTTYYYVVAAVDPGMESAGSAEVSATPGIDAPAWLAAAAGDGEVKLAWADVANAASYTLYWSTSAGVTPATGTAIPGVTSPYTHTGLGNGTTYHYVVVAEDAGGAAGAPSMERQATPSAGALAAPTVASVSLPAGPLRGVVPITYEVRDVAARRVDVLVEVDPTGAGPFRRATQAGRAPGAGPTGVEGVATSAGGVVHTFLWDSVADLNGEEAPAARVRVTPLLARVPGTPAEATGVWIDDAASFGARTDLTTGGMGAAGIVVVDLDGDGWLDLLVAEESSDTLAVVLRGAGGVYQTSVRYVAGAGPRSLATGDVDRDGERDVVVTSSGSLLTLHLQDPAAPGALLAAQTIALSAPASRVALADLDGDGWLDLVAALPSTDEVAVLRQDPANPGTFLAAVEYSVGAGPAGVALGDLDADGRLDVVTANQGGSSVSVLLQDAAGGGALTAAVDHPLADAPSALALGDVDRDGRLDVVTVSAATAGAALLRQDPADPRGDLLAPVAVALPFVALDVTLADLDADGRLDLVAPSAAGGQVAVARQDPVTRGAFRAARTFTTLQASSGVAVGDLDADGDVDLAVTTFSGHAVSVLPNTLPRRGDPGLRGPEAHATVSFPLSVRGGDVNGDGKPDLVVGRQDGAVLIFQGFGDGRLELTATLNSGSTVLYAAASDLDADGLTDVLVGNANGLQVHYQQVGGGFAAPVVFSSGNAVFDFDVADVDGDGALDVLGSVSPFVVTVFFQDPANRRTFSGVSLPASQPRGVRTLDLDGDGRLDVVDADFGTATLGLHRQVTARTFSSSTIALPGGSGPRSIDVADLDRDGRDDVVVSLQLTGHLAVLLQDPAGGLQTPTAYPVGGYLYAVVAGDVTGDGRPDLLVAQRQVAAHLLPQDPVAPGRFLTARRIHDAGPCTALGLADLDADGRPDLAAPQDDGSLSQLVIVRSDGRPGLDLAPRAAEGRDPYSVAISDLDRDGRDDLVALNVADETISVAPADPAAEGSFLAPVTFAGPASGRAIAAADVDRDGRPDLVAVGDGVTLYRQSAAGTFSSAWSAALTASGVRDVPRIVDIDRDGWLDLTVASAASNEVRIYLQDPAAPGTFGAPVLVATGASTGPAQVAAGDLDGDGDLDLVVTCMVSNTLLVFRQDATATFTSVGSYAVGTQPRGVAVADLDRDGRLDVVVASRQSRDVHVLLHDASAGLGLQAPVRHDVGTPVQELAVLDVDRDGRLDLVCASTAGAAVTVLLQDPAPPAGRFVVDRQLATVIDLLDNLAVADLDRDGLLDVVRPADALVVLRGR